MNVFLEHILPGTFLFVFGVWLNTRVWRNYVHSMARSSQPYTSQLSYPTNCRRCNVDIMAIILCVASAMGILTQLTHIHHSASYQTGSSHVDVTTLHHVTIYFFFGLIGVFRLLHKLLKRLVPQIEIIEYLVFIMALCNQALLFKFHLIGRDPLNTLLHTYLLYVVYACVIITFAEMTFRYQVFFALGRAYFIILQGTWLWQLAFILDNPLPDPGTWKSENNEDLMLTTCIFTWHIGGVLLFSVTCGIGWICFYKKRGTLRDLEIAMEPIVYGYSQLSNLRDDNEEAVE